MSPGQALADLLRHLPVTKAGVWVVRACEHLGIDPYTTNPEDLARLIEHAIQEQLMNQHALVKASKRHDIDYTERMAGLAASSAFHKMRPADAAVLIMTGAELGLAPMEALRSIHVINGKPTLSADLMTSLVLSSGLAVFFQPKEMSDTSVTYATRRNGAPADVEITWTIEMAKRAGLLKNPTWNRYPRAMLRARASAELARAVYPDVLLGVYTPEELGAQVNEAGEVTEVVEAEWEEAPSEHDRREEVTLEVREMLESVVSSDDAVRVEARLVELFLAAGKIPEEVEFYDLPMGLLEGTRSKLKKKKDLSAWAREQLAPEAEEPEPEYTSLERATREWHALVRETCHVHAQAEKDEERAKELRREADARAKLFHDATKRALQVARWADLSEEVIRDDIRRLRAMSDRDRFLHIKERADAERPTPQESAA